MKKFLFVLLMILGLAFNTQAQTATLISLAAGDTISTTSSRDTVSKVITATGAYASLGIQVKVTKVSGTVAGKAYLYSSLDGTNYTLTDSSSAFTDQTTNTAFFTKTSVPYTYYKVTVQDAIGGSASTQSTIARFYYVFRKYHD
jgi:hypothetical protein